MVMKPFFDTLQGSIWAHFGTLLEPLGSLLGPRGVFVEVLEGSEHEVEKRDPPVECRYHGLGGGPYKEIEMEGDGGSRPGWRWE